MIYERKVLTGSNLTDGSAALPSVLRINTISTGEYNYVDSTKRYTLSENGTIGNNKYNCAIDFHADAMGYTSISEYATLIKRRSYLGNMSNLIDICQASNYSVQTDYLKSKFKIFDLGYIPETMTVKNYDVTAKVYDENGKIYSMLAVAYVYLYSSKKVVLLLNDATSSVSKIVVDYSYRNLNSGKMLQKNAYKETNISDLYASSYIADAPYLTSTYLDKNQINYGNSLTEKQEDYFTYVNKFARSSASLPDSSSDELKKYMSVYPFSSISKFTFGSTSIVSSNDASNLLTSIKANGIEYTKECYAFENGSKVGTRIIDKNTDISSVDYIETYVSAPKMVRYLVKKIDTTDLTEAVVRNTLADAKCYLWKAYSDESINFFKINSNRIVSCIESADYAEVIISEPDALMNPDDMSYETSSTNLGELLHNTIDNRSVYDISNMHSDASTVTDYESSSGILTIPFAATDKWVMTSIKEDEPIIKLYDVETDNKYSYDKLIFGNLASTLTDRTFDILPYSDDVTSATESDEIAKLKESDYAGRRITAADQIFADYKNLNDYELKIMQNILAFKPESDASFETYANGSIALTGSNACSGIIFKIKSSSTMSSAMIIFNKDGLEISRSIPVIEKNNNKYLVVLSGGYSSIEIKNSEDVESKFYVR